jgi:Cu(I)/Ag(I) efflux system membrane fusion protein
MLLRIAGLLGLTGAMIAAGLLFFFPDFPALLAGGTYRWEAVTPEVAAAPGQRLSIRLIGPEGAVVQGAEIISTRLDMAPEGMAAMDAPLVPDGIGEAGTFSYRADFAMAGRWALHLKARLPGQSEFLTGEIVLTAVDPARKAEGGKDDRKLLYYRNPMGLPDTSPIPKKDSMGMDYIPVYAEEASAPAGTLRVSLDKVQRSGVRTETAERRSMSRILKVPGIVEPDESRVAAVTVRFNGFIDELYVGVTGREVKEGEPLARIWIEKSEILQKQADYLLAVKASGGRQTPDVERAERNLTLSGFPKEEIASLKAGGEPVRFFTLKAPADGTVMEKAAMRGMRFESGEMLFKTIDLSQIWVVADVPEREIGRIAEGQPAKVTLAAFPDEQFEGSVLLVHPELDKATRTAKVRIGLPNPKGRIKANLFAEVEIETGGNDGEAVAVPQSAVIDSGERQVVIVEREQGLYEPRNVKLGRTSGGYTEIQSGLNAGERVVVSGNFLIDSESNLRASLDGLNAGGTTQ